MTEHHYPDGSYDIDWAADERDAAALHLWDEGLVRPESLAFAVVDALIAEGYFRRQGPITDEWEYASERYVDLFGGVQVRRIRRRKAGPWEPVEAARDAS